MVSLIENKQGGNIEKFWFFDFEDVKEKVLNIEKSIQRRLDNLEEDSSDNWEDLVNTTMRQTLYDMQILIRTELGDFTQYLKEEELKKDES